MCNQSGKTKNDELRMKFPSFFFKQKTAYEMFGIFREIPEALQRTVDIASRCNVKIDRIPNPFPEFKVPDGHTAGSYFEKVGREGFATRAPYLERLAKSGALSDPSSGGGGRVG